MKLISLLDQAIFAATVFFTTVIAGRVFSPQELGAYYLALTLVMLLRGVQCELTLSPYTVYCHRCSGSELARYAGSTLASHLLLSGVGAASLAAAAGFAWAVGRASDAAVAGMVAVVLPLLLLREHIRRFAFAHLRPVSAFLLDTAVAGLQLVGLLLLAEAGRLTVAATYAVMGLACALGGGAWLVRHRAMFAFDRGAWLADWRRNWGFAQWTLTGFVVGSAAAWFLPWWLAFTHGEAATGRLAACQTLVGVSNMFVTGISNLLTPQAASAFATGGVAALWRVITRAATVYSIGLGGLCLVFLVAGEPLIRLAFDSHYTGAGPVLTLLSLSVLAQGLSVTAGNGLWAIERPRTNLAADVCALVLTLGTTACLITTLGVLAVAIATLTGAAGGAAVRWFLLWTELQTVEHAAAPA